MIEDPAQGPFACQNCGGQVVVGSSFCPACGAAVAQPQVPQTPAADRSAPQGFGQTPGYPPAYDYAPAMAQTQVSADRSRTPIFLVLAALALIAVFIVGAAFVLAVGRSHGPSSTIVYQVTPPAGQAVTDSQLTTIVAILNQRLVLDGVDGSAQKQPPDMVSVQVTGVTDLTAFASRIGVVGKLEFILLPPQTYGDVTTAGSVPVPDEGSVIDPTLPAQFTGNDLDYHSVNAAPDPVMSSNWIVNFKFAGTKATEFGTWTADHVNDYFAIVVDGVAESVPYIYSAITGGYGEISGDFTEAQAKDLAAILGAGALPLPLTVVSTKAAATA